MTFLLNGAMGLPLVLRAAASMLVGLSAEHSCKWHMWLRHAARAPALSPGETV